MVRGMLRAEMTREIMLRQLNRPPLRLKRPVRKKLTRKAVLTLLHRQIDAAAKKGLPSTGIYLGSYAAQEIGVLKKALVVLAKEGYTVIEIMDCGFEIPDDDYQISW
jgi:hypothetical protein